MNTLRRFVDYRNSRASSRHFVALLAFLGLFFSQLVRADFGWATVHASTTTGYIFPTNAFEAASDSVVRSTYLCRLSEGSFKYYGSFNPLDYLYVGCQAYGSSGHNNLNFDVLTYDMPPITMGGQIPSWVDSSQFGPAPQGAFLVDTGTSGLTVPCKADIGYRSYVGVRSEISGGCQIIADGVTTSVNPYKVLITTQVNPTPVPGGGGVGGGGNGGRPPVSCVPHCLE